MLSVCKLVVSCCFSRFLLFFGMRESGELNSKQDPGFPSGLHCRELAFMMMGHAVWNNVRAYWALECMVS